MVSRLATNIGDRCEWSTLINDPGPFILAIHLFLPFTHKPLLSCLSSSANLPVLKANISDFQQTILKVKAVEVMSFHQVAQGLGLKGG